MNFPDSMKNFENNDREVDKVEHGIGEEQAQLLSVLGRPIDIDETKEAIEHANRRPKNDSLVFANIIVVFDVVGYVHQQHELIKCNQEAKDQKAVDTLIAETVVVSKTEVHIHLTGWVYGSYVEVEGQVLNKVALLSTVCANFEIQKENALLSFHLSPSYRLPLNVDLTGCLVYRGHSKSKHKLVLESGEAVVQPDIYPVARLIAIRYVQESERC